MSELCQIPHETPDKQHDLRGHSDAQCCCGKVLMERALVSVGVHYCARPESISKRAPSTTRTSLRVCRINHLRALGWTPKSDCAPDCALTPLGVSTHSNGCRGARGRSAERFVAVFGAKELVEAYTSLPRQPLHFANTLAGFHSGRLRQRLTGTQRTLTECITRRVHRPARAPAAARPRPDPRRRQRCRCRSVPRHQGDGRRWHGAAQARDHD